MTATDPGDEIILEPGDPGYVEPGSTVEPTPPPTVPAGAEGAGAPAPPGQDLQHVRNPHETDAEFLSRTRGEVVHSESPTDIVPNTPQISMSPQEVVPEEPTSPPPSPEQGETQETSA